MTDATVIVTLQCFGELQRWCGAGGLRVELTPGEATAQAAIASLAADYPQAEATLQRSACAVGDRLVQRHETLNDGDLIALIPPVSGG